MPESYRVEAFKILLTAVATALFVNLTDHLLRGREQDEQRKYQERKDALAEVSSVFGECRDIFMSEKTFEVGVPNASADLLNAVRGRMQSCYSRTNAMQGRVSGAVRPLFGDSLRVVFDSVTTRMAAHARNAIMGAEAAASTYAVETQLLLRDMDNLEDVLQAATFKHRT